MDSSWYSRLDEVQAYINVHGRIPVEAKHDMQQSELGRWLRGQRVRYLGGRLPFPQMVALDRTVPGWRKAVIQRFILDYTHASRFMDEHGRLPRRYGGEPDEERAALWLQQQASATWLSGNRAAQLTAGFGEDWRRERQAPDAEFRKRVTTLKAWRAGADRWPHIAGDTQAERDIAWFLTGVRDDAERGVLTDSRKRRLDAAAPGWDQNLYPRYLRPARLACQQVATYDVEHGHLPSHGSPIAYERKLGNILNNRRRQYRQGRLQDEWKIPLDELVPHWKGRRGARPNYGYQDFESRVEELVHFHSLYNHWPRVLRKQDVHRSQSQNEQVLGNFIAHCRSLDRKGLLLEDRRALLDGRCPGWDTVQSGGVAQAAA